MKTLKVLAVVVVVAVIAAVLAYFVTSSKTYTVDDITVSDVTSEHSDVADVSGVTLHSVGKTNAEVWVFESADSAQAWYNERVESLENRSALIDFSHSGTDEYNTQLNLTYYRLKLDDTVCIYAYGNKSAVNFLVDNIELG